MTKRSVPLDELLRHIQSARGFDFTGYKPTTLERRVQKRMATVGAADYGAYLDLLAARPDEFTELFNTILINVTSFFRDPDVWDFLQKDALARILSEKGDRDPIRVWSAGCSSGQEAYTIAMLVAEGLHEGEPARRLKVYATDVDEDALRLARRASYSADDVQSVPPPLREKYLEPVAGRFVLRRDLRRCVIFGRHDLIHDPPISRIDLILCRNTIMYLNAATQERIALRLHFALAPRGVLVLGKAEMMSHPELFTSVDLKLHIFLKSSSDVAPRRIQMRVPSKPEQTQDGGLARLREHAFDASPVAQIVVDANAIVLQISRRAREIFGLTEQDQGRLLRDLEISYRPVELRSMIEDAYAKGRSVVVTDVEHPRSGDVRHYEVQVMPLLERATSVWLGAEISFIDITERTRLEQQLRRTNAELQVAFEQLQSTSEELETTNEELQSTNEELETTNEELHSANEELQSTNEELQAMNEELQVASDELTSANLSLEAILATLRSAVVVVDRDLRVKSWSARAEDMWGVRRDEAVGKSLMGLDIGLPVDKLRSNILACLDGKNGGEVALDATNRRGRAIACRVACLPLAGGEEDARGVVLVIAEASPR